MNGRAAEFATPRRWHDMGIKRPVSWNGDKKISVAVFTEPEGNTTIAACKGARMIDLTFEPADFAEWVESEILPRYEAAKATAAK